MRRFTTQVKQFSICMAVGLGMIILAPAVAGAQTATSANDTASSHVSIAGAWIRATFDNYNDCVAVKKLGEDLYGYATLPMTDSCYHDQYGYYFYWWDEDA